MATRNNNSVVATGCTKLSWPNRRATANSAPDSSISPNPASQIPRRMAYEIRLSRIEDPEGADSTPIRCSTAVTALTNAAAAAGAYAMRNALAPRGDRRRTESGRDGGRARCPAAMVTRCQPIALDHGYATRRDRSRHRDRSRPA